MSGIQFFFEEIEPTKLPEQILSKWFSHTIENEGYSLDQLNYIICSDEYLYNINVEYLNHEYYTDVITFDNSEEDEIIDGDIFISLDRVVENAASENITMLEELRRIMIHGLLHLVGFQDKSLDDKTLMTEKENAYLSLPQFQISQL